MLIYLPVETSRRELVAKVFTATMLAGKGYPVALFRRDFFDPIGWPSAGVYIGKNCFKYSGFGEEKHYYKMKDEGIRIWHLEEEGGVYIGDSEEEWSKIFLKRLNPEVFREDDKIFTWGEWQTQLLLGLRPKCPVHMTGSPNFDMLNPSYFDALADFDSTETGGRENFILVNTRFALSNGLFSIKEHLKEDSQIAQHVDPRSLRHWITECGILQFSFISLLQNLAELMTDVEFVLRPHPAEHPDLYSDLLGGFPNVSVEWRGDAGSWIRRCRALIHNGCSTAVQAQIARKPVITYLPINEADGFSPGLPNLIGEKCRTLSEVVAAIERDKAADGHEVLSRTISNMESIKEIVAMVEKECPSPVGRSGLDQIVAKVEEAARRGKRRDTRKRLERQLLRKKARKGKGMKFDADFFGRAAELCSAAKKHMDCDVEVMTPHAACHLFLPRNSA